MKVASIKIKIPAKKQLNWIILYFPIHFPVQGQWWSCSIIQILHILQWTTFNFFGKIILQILQFWYLEISSFSEIIKLFI